MQSPYRMMIAEGYDGSCLTEMVFEEVSHLDQQEQARIINEVIKQLKEALAAMHNQAEYLWDFTDAPGYRNPRTKYSD